MDKINSGAANNKQTSSASNKVAASMPDTPATENLAPGSNSRSGATALSSAVRTRNTVWTSSHQGDLNMVSERLDQPFAYITAHWRHLDHGHEPVSHGVRLPLS